MLGKILETDKTWLLALNGTWGETADKFFWFASQNWAWIPLYLLILYVVYRRYGWKTMVVFLAFVALSVTLADQICNMAKYGLRKPRPSHTPDIKELVYTLNGYRGGPYGTFSAHAATTACIAVFSSRFFKRTWFTVFMTLWVVVVCYSRIYLGVHYPLDILCGGATGFLFGWYSYKLFLNFQLRCISSPQKY